MIEDGFLLSFPLFCAKLFIKQLKTTHMKKLALLSLLFVSAVQMSLSQVPNLYLGQTPPGNTPEIFAPGIVSLPGRNERVITFSPSGNEIFFAIGNYPTRSTMYMQYKDSAWTSPVLASFSTDRSAEEPFFSMDGSRVYYYAFPPFSSSNADLYYSEKSGDVWSDPVNVGSTLNTAGDEFHPNIVNDGSIYFANGAGKTCRSQYSGGSFLPRVLLPANVNSGAWPDHYVAPDESYMIFTSTMAGGFGSSDLYISFRNADSSWTTPQNFGNKINTAGYEGSADITPDGIYMTFDNSADIYWVKIDNVIDSLKAISGVTSSVNAIHGHQGFKICPNPNAGRFNLYFDSAPGKTAMIEISNLEGEIILKRVVENSTTIDLPGTGRGICFIKLFIDNQIFTQKICLE
jgi:hypothetical protein